MAFDEFRECLKERAGPALRVISWYDGDRYGTLFVRDDLDRRRVEDRIEFVSEAVRVDGRPTADEALATLGGERAMVQVRDEAVILRFPLEPSRGFIVSLDIDVATNLHGFVLECAERLTGGTMARDPSEPG